jgi:hypothetical protein
VRQRAKVLLDGTPNKPALLSEFGMTADNWQRSQYVDADEEYVHLHDGLWTSAFSGLSGAALSWFWEDIERKNMYHHYRPLAAFVADIPFTTAGLHSARIVASDKRLRVVGLQGNACAYLWVSNSEATWWKIGVDKVSPSEIQSAQLTLEGLQPGAYRVQWWDTWKGVIITQEKVQSKTAQIELKVPAFSRDVACKIMP